MSTNSDTVFLNNTLNKFGVHAYEMWKAGAEDKSFDGWKIAKKKNASWFMRFFSVDQMYAHLSPDLKAMTVFENPTRFTKAANALRKLLKEKKRVELVFHSQSRWFSN